MKTQYRLPSLCVGTVLSLALCASAFADSDGKSVVTQRQYQAVQKPTRVVYYVKSSASAIPTLMRTAWWNPEATTRPMLGVGNPPYLELRGLGLATKFAKCRNRPRAGQGWFFLRA